MATELVFKNEADVKKHIKKLLAAHNWFHWMPPANGFGKPAVDHHALRDGVFLAIEAKHTQTSRKATQGQKVFLQQVHVGGGIAVVVNEKTIGWFDTWLIAYDEAIRCEAAGEKASDEDGALMMNAYKVLTQELT